MAYMGVGDYEEAMNRLDTAVENPETIRRIDYATYLAANYWNDPTLEQPEGLEMRDRIAFRE